MKDIKPGDCVKLPDGRTGRVREKKKDKIRVRVKRKNSESNQFLYFKPSELKKIECPEGWMSPEGYRSYLRKTLAKMKERMRKKK
jgi:ribosomal protein L21E